MQRLSAQVTEADSMASPTPAEPGMAGPNCFCIQDLPHAF